MNNLLVNDEIKCVNQNLLEGNSNGPDVKLGDIYPLKSIHTCSCGKQHYDVGLPLTLNYVTCYDCKEELPDTTHWCHPSRFELAPSK